MLVLWSDAVLGRAKNEQDQVHYSLDPSPAVMPWTLAPRSELGPDEAMGVRPM